MSDFKRELGLAFTENRFAVCSSAAIFLLSLAGGYLLESLLYAYLNPVVENFSRQVQSGAITLTFQSIFFNNIRIVLLMFILGVFSCFSVVILAFNGFFAGYYVANTENVLWTSLLIIPHGIFEFSSCILACASGFVLFNFVYRFLKAFSNNRNNSIRKRLSLSYDASWDKLKQALILLAVSAVLMVVASVVEVYLTLPIARFVYPIIS